MSTGGPLYRFRQQRRKGDGNAIDGASGGEHRLSAGAAGMATAGLVHLIAQTPNLIPTVDRRPRTSANSIQNSTYPHASNPEGYSPPSSSDSSSTISEPSSSPCQRCGSSKLDIVASISDAAPRPSATVLVASAETPYTERILIENFTYSHLASRGVFTSPGSIQPLTSNVRGAVRGSRDAMPPSADCIVCALAEPEKRTENEMRIRKGGDGNEASGQLEMPDVTSRLPIPEAAGNPEARWAASEMTTDGDTETVVLSSSPTRVYDSDDTIPADGPDWTI